MKKEKSSTDDFIAGLGESADCGDGGHASGEAEGARSAVQLRQLSLQRVSRWIPRPRIVVLALE